MKEKKHYIMIYKVPIILFLWWSFFSLTENFVYGRKEIMWQKLFSVPEVLFMLQKCLSSIIGQRTRGWKMCASTQKSLCGCTPFWPLVQSKLTPTKICNIFWNWCYYLHTPRDQCLQYSWFFIYFHFYSFHNLVILAPSAFSPNAITFTKATIN